MKQNAEISFTSTNTMRGYYIFKRQKLLNQTLNSHAKIITCKETRRGEKNCRGTNITNSRNCCFVPEWQVLKGIILPLKMKCKKKNTSFLKNEWEPGTVKAPAVYFYASDIIIHKVLHRLTSYHEPRGNETASGRKRGLRRLNYRARCAPQTEEKPRGGDANGKLASPQRYPLDRQFKNGRRWFD